MPMSSIETLRREYPGDPAWARFAAVFSADVVNGLQDAARSLLPNDLGPAETLIGMFGWDGGGLAQLADRCAGRSVACPYTLDPSRRLPDRSSRPDAYAGVRK